MGTTSSAGQFAAPAGAPSSCFFKSSLYGDRIFSAYCDANNHISVLIMDPTNPGAQPICLDVTEETIRNGFSPAAPAGAPFCMSFVGIQLHIIYRDVDGKISDILYTEERQSPWMYQNVTDCAIQAGHQPNQAAGDPVMANYGTDSHFTYLDVHDHISDIYWDTEIGKWTYQDLSALTNASAATGTPCLVEFAGKLLIFFRLQNPSQMFGQIIFDKSFYGWRYQQLPLSEYEFGPPSAVATESTLYLFSMSGASSPEYFASSDGTNFTYPNPNILGPNVTPHMQGTISAVSTDIGTIHIFFRTGVNDDNLGHYMYDLANPQSGWQWWLPIAYGSRGENVSASPSALAVGSSVFCTFFYQQGMDPLSDNPNSIWVVYAAENGQFTSVNLSALA